MKKRVFTALLALGMVLQLTACSFNGSLTVE